MLLSQRPAAAVMSQRPAAMTQVQLHMPRLHKLWLLCMPSSSTCSGCSAVQSQCCLLAVWALFRAIQLNSQLMSSYVITVIVIASLPLHVDFVLAQLGTVPLSSSC